MKQLKSLISALVLLSPLSANAGLIGTEVGCSITPTPFWICDQPSNVVGSGAEFELQLPQSPDYFGLSVDISDSSIQISSTKNTIFGLGAGELLTLSFDADVLGISNFVASNVSVISLSSISFIDNMLSIDLNNGATWDVGSYVSFDIDTATASVPEPGTLMLMGLGLAGIGFSRKKKSV